MLLAEREQPEVVAGPSDPRRLRITGAGRAARLGSVEGLIHLEHETVWEPPIHRS
ncbi:hypothetical protein [Streptomyces caelestis]|uniref:hypothetical protein n=1 Tax=Streptomyces caelestis TaxID=36816 RepID=UPI00365E7B29